MRLRGFQFAVAVLTVAMISGCSRPGMSSGGEEKAGGNRPSRHAGARNLAADEEEGGHTLKKHVGRSDGELRERLRREPRISAASTYTDRRTAEDFIGECLSENESRIGQWMERDRHPNLVLDCVGDPAWPIGRSLRWGPSEIEPCSQAMVVLKWRTPRDYFVLTSYLDCR